MLPFESRGAMEKFILESLDDMMVLVRTLDHPQRMKLLALMVSGPKNFQELMKATHLQKSALGNHFGVLTARNLLEKVDRGSYRLTEDGQSIVERLAQGYLETKVREKERLEKTRNLIERYTTHGEESMDKEEIKIWKMNVRIVDLDPMTVASVQVVSNNPEEEAWGKLSEWAEAQGLLSDLENHPLFGFDVPIDTSDQGTRGYEYWIRVDPNTQPEGEIQVKEFQGGSYAVTECKVEGNPFATIPTTWTNLVKWVNAKKYNLGSHQPLEKHLSLPTNLDGLVLELYCPIKK